MIFYTLLAVGVITIALGSSGAFQIFKRFKAGNAYERRRIKQAISSLERQKYIKETMGGYYELTSQGRLKALRHKIETIKITAQKKWDRKWRFIMFDIPEENKQARQAVNFVLKKMGCVHYQKSVFITPFPCKKEVDFIGECFGVKKHIRMVVAEKIDDEQKYKEVFRV